jgi:DNA-nicking Smr family endonuclease
MKKKHNKYEQEASRELDLHGYTKAEAEPLLKDFLEESLESRLSIVRVVTGKGLHSEDGIPVLKNFVTKYLTHNGFHFRMAKINRGGTGAIDVIL